MAMFDSDIWSCIINKLPRDYWFNTSLVCKASNKGFKKYMTIQYGQVNTWKPEILFFAHKWRCLQQNNPPIIEKAPYPEAFENPASTII